MTSPKRRELADAFEGLYESHVEDLARYVRRRVVPADAEAAVAVDDHRGWPPLLYACYPHWHRTRPSGTRPAPLQHLYQVFTVEDAQVIVTRAYPDRESALNRKVGNSA